MTAILELTHRCNEQCVHCYVIKPAGMPPELTTAQWKDILGQLAAAGTIEVTFSGGEVFLRRDLFDILDEARRLHFSIKLSTNATLVGPEEAQRLRDVRPWEIGVSLYAAEASIHDGITLLPGSHERTVAGIERMVAQGIRVKIRSVLMRENLGQEAALAHLAERLGASFAQDPLLTPRSDGSLDNLLHRLDPQQLRRTLEVDADRILGEDNPKKWDAVREDRLHSYMCKAGINFCTIGPQGGVLPCVQFQQEAGNATERPFAQIWKCAPLFQRLRATVNADIAKCRDCELAPLCFRCPGEALLSDGDAFGPSSYACLRAGFLSELREARRTVHPEDQAT
ncbi:MAG: radical SAM protein [Candidatus Eisenbacteria bacterium]|nr:radical SAM protein [Candidatus Eisenbacteria bacterium]